MTPIIMRPATIADLPAITDIHNDVIATSTAIYSTAPVTLENRRAWFDARIAGGFPVLVATDGDQVLGFSSFGEFRGPWTGYRFSVEHSVHVRSDRRGQGIGSGLIEALFPLAMATGKHAMIGAIDAANEGSLRLHERLGFNRVARLPEVGYKFGRWLDLILVQRFVDAPGAGRDD